NVSASGPTFSCQATRSARASGATFSLQATRSVTGGVLPTARTAAAPAVPRSLARRSRQLRRGLAAPEIVVVMRSDAQLDRHGIRVPSRGEFRIVLRERLVPGGGDLDRGVRQLLQEALDAELDRGGEVRVRVQLERQRILDDLAVVLDHDAI